MWFNFIYSFSDDQRANKGGGIDDEQIEVIE